MKIHEAFNASCAETARLMSEHAEGELGGIKRWRIARHLSGCERCRAVYRTLLGTIDTLRRLRGEEPAPQPELADGVSQQLARES